MGSAGCRGVCWGVQDLNALSLAELFDALTRDGCLNRLAKAAAAEDLGWVDGEPVGGGSDGGDVTAEVTIGASAVARGVIAARAGGVVAGLRAVPGVLAVLGPRVTARPLAEDGEEVEKGRAVMGLEGPAREVLRAERTVLNLLGRLSGVATLTAAYVERVRGTRVHLLDTRKTTPGLRNLEKYAVRCGGGRCHRLGLFDAVLIKDNHLAGVGDDELAGVVERAAEQARARFGVLRFVEVEVDRLAQFAALLEAGVCGGPGRMGAVDVVMLDNMSVEELREGVAMRDAAGASVQIEASGGVRLETVRAIAETGVERISIGAVTHQATGLDFGLDFEG